MIKATSLRSATRLPGRGTALPDGKRVKDVLTRYPRLPHTMKLNQKRVAEDSYREPKQRFQYSPEFWIHAAENNANRFWFSLRPGLYLRSLERKSTLSRTT